MNPKTLMANSQGQTLWEHSLRVAETARYMAKCMGASVEIQNFCYIVGLLHDIGKAIYRFQQYLRHAGGEYHDLDAPRHHEVSWAIAVTIFGSADFYSCILFASYWHHARPANKKWEYSRTDECPDCREGNNAYP